VLRSIPSPPAILPMVRPARSRVAGTGLGSWIIRRNPDTRPAPRAMKATRQARDRTAFTRRSTAFHVRHAAIYCGDNLARLKTMPDDWDATSSTSTRPSTRTVCTRRSGARRRETRRSRTGMNHPRLASTLCGALRRLARVLRNRQPLLPLRLARQPLRQGDVGITFSGRTTFKTRSSGSERGAQRSSKVWRRTTIPSLLLGLEEGLWNRQYTTTRRNT